MKHLFSLEILRLKEDIDMFINIMKNEKGGIFVIAAAVVVTIVTFVSSATLMNMVNTDQLNTQYQHDKIQEELLLRTELTRTSLAIEQNRYIPLPDRVVKIFTPTRRTTYTIDNHKVRARTGYSVQSLIKAEREGKSGRKVLSPIKRMTERYLNPKSLAEYQYITQTEASENEDGGFAASLVKFYNQDELYGPLHSNSDIYLQNNSWPVFYSLVTTTGHFKVVTSQGAYVGLATQVAPMNDIFLGGWEEEVPEVIFEPNAEEIRQNGIELGNDDTDIVYVNLGTGSFELKYGEINDIETVELDVFSWFPSDIKQVEEVIAIGGNWYEDADYIFTNVITKKETLWTNINSFPINNNSFWIPNGELWIKGEVSGSTTFGCADTVFIVGHITYAGTSPGSWPDGFSGIDPGTGEPLYTGPVNHNDYFGLVSEQKILIRYKHREPINGSNIIIDDNCNSIYLYGAYAAIAEGDIVLHGDMACHYDGIFTFQYQHPHGSTPNFIAPSPYITREFTIELYDSGGNGWDDATIDVIVNGNLILDDIYCTGSQSTFEFDVDNGDLIETQYTNGGSDDENSYTIFDHEGNVIFSDGPPPIPGYVSPMILLEPTNMESLYTFVDLQKYIFPINNYIPNAGFNLHGANPINGNPCGYPIESWINNTLIDPNGYILSYPNSGGNYVYPYGTDYPWYNPVWPEPSTDQVNQYERGAIHLYGAVAQRRRGFVHRSGGDPYNHPYGNSNPSPWEMEDYHYDGNHPSTGYDKDYYYDRRFLEVTPPDFPQIHENWGQYNLAGFVQKSWFFKSPGDWGF